MALYDVSQRVLTCDSGGNRRRHGASKALYICPLQAALLQASIARNNVVTPTVGSSDGACAYHNHLLGFIVTALCPMPC